MSSTAEDFITSLPQLIYLGAGLPCSSWQEKNGGGILMIHGMCGTNWVPGTKLKMETLQTTLRMYTFWLISSTRRQSSRVPGPCPHGQTCNPSATVGGWLDSSYATIRVEAEVFPRILSLCPLLPYFRDLV